MIPRVGHKLKKISVKMLSKFHSIIERDEKFCIDNMYSIMQSTQNKV